MEKNEIIKEIRKQKPKANLCYIKKGEALYFTSIIIHCEGGPGNQPILFNIPVSDMGDASFLPEMESQLLIRWIQ